MDITFRVIFLFLHGIIASTMIQKLTTKKPPHQIEFFMSSLLYGSISYLILFVIFSFINYIGKLFSHNLNLSLTFFDSIFSDGTKLVYSEIIYASIIAFCFSFFIVFTINNDWIYKFANKLKISNQTGTVSVWKSVFNKGEVNWIVVRDYLNDIMYEGYTNQISDDNEVREFFIRDVDVYKNSTGEFFYNVDAIYISPNFDNVIVEIRKLEGDANDKEGK